MKVRDIVTTWMRRQGASEHCITKTIKECEIMFGHGDQDIPGDDEKIIARMDAEFKKYPPEFWKKFNTDIAQRN